MLPPPGIWATWIPSPLATEGLGFGKSHRFPAASRFPWLLLRACTHAVIPPIFWKSSLGLISFCSSYFLSGSSFYQHSLQWLLCLLAPIAHVVSAILSGQASGPSTPGALLSSRPSWPVLLTPRVSPGPQLVTMDHFLLLQTVASKHLILGFPLTSLDTLPQPSLLVSPHCPDF